MADEKNYQCSRVLNMADVSEINRALGIIVGLCYVIQDDDIITGLLKAVDRIEAVLGKGND